jgi:hypothetical protein
MLCTDVHIDNPLASVLSFVKFTDTQCEPGTVDNCSSLILEICQFAYKPTHVSMHCLLKEWLAAADLCAMHHHAGASI